jgi:formylmethanofuran dehydrogenase subunit A
MQWAIGLEWYLLMKDPWRLALTTDHPNGGSFLAYPQIIQLLMDRACRQEVLKRAHPRLMERSILKDLDREYTLSEIAIITRAAPARILGLHRKGHLGPGADADITIYTPNADRRQMFALPRYVIKAGEIVVHDGEIADPTSGSTLYTTPPFDAGIIPHVAQWFEENGSIDFGNYSVENCYLSTASTAVACGPVL